MSSLEKATKFIMNGDYYQSHLNRNEGKFVEGRLKYRGKSKSDLVFEDIEGILHTFTSADIEANPFLEPYTTKKDRVELLDEQANMNPKYKHSPTTLLLQAYAYKYGIKPQVSNVYRVVEEDKEELLAYKASMKGQDFLLIIDKENGRPNYNFYDAGWCASNGMEPEEIKVGKRYYVDNQPYICIKNDDEECVFGKIRKRDFTITEDYDHIRVFHNVQQRFIDKGEIEATDPASFVDAPKEVFVKHMNDDVYITKETNERLAYSGDKNVYFHDLYKDLKVNKYTSAVINKTEEGKVYLTPYGHLKLKKKIKEMKKTPETYTKVKGILQKGDACTADQYLNRRMIYQFGEDIYFNHDNLRSGIIQKALESGKVYRTEDGDVKYLRQEPLDLTIMNIENIPEIKNKKTAVDGILFVANQSGDTSLKINHLAIQPIYIFEDIKTGKQIAFSYMDIIEGAVHEKEFEKHYKEVEKKKDKERILQEVRKAESTTPEPTAIPNDSLKVSYRGLKPFGYYSTEIGIAQYYDKGIKDGQNHYYFINVYGNILDYTMDELTKGYIQEPLVQGHEYLTKKGDVIVFQSCTPPNRDADPESYAVYTFTNKEGQWMNTTMKALINGSIRKARVKK